MDNIKCKAMTFVGLRDKAKARRVPIEVSIKHYYNIVEHEVSRCYGITVDDMREVTRKREIAFPRQIAMNIMHKLNVKHLKGHNWRMIGARFGKDHATAMHSVKAVNNALDTDKQFTEVYKGIINELRKYGIYL